MFTGGGTEADNLAIAGVHAVRRGRVVCAAIEHHAVLHACAALGGDTVRRSTPTASSTSTPWPPRSTTT